VNQFLTRRTKERREIVEYYLTVVARRRDAQAPRRTFQGMRQRVGIARRSRSSRRCCWLDEPFGMLDTLTRYELQQVLIELWRKNKITALMVTHDVDEALF